MKWQIEYIADMPAKKINGRSYIDREELISFLSRRCKDCAYYKEMADTNYKGRKTKRTLCTNAINMPKMVDSNGNLHNQTVRFTYSTNHGCKRFEKREMNNVGV